MVGCRITEYVVVFPEFNTLNPDMQDERYDTECGIYKAGCGIDKLMFAWGHNEYMYRMLVANSYNDNSNNNCCLPTEALDMIRYHSAYPWHEKGN